VSNNLLLEKGKQAIIDGDQGLALQFAQDWLADGLQALEFIDKALIPGIREVGRLWEEGEFFLPELVSGAEAMKSAMGILESRLTESNSEYRHRKTVIIGTVQGDIHDIGKSMVATMLRANGFNIIDLGSDVPPEKFLEATLRSNASLVCTSALLTTTMTGIPQLIQKFEEQGLRSSIKFMVGGAPVTRQWADEIGADGYGDSAVEAIRVAKELIGNS